MTPTLDGSLASWDDVRRRAAWKGVLLGNGMSINIWGGFAYGRLYDRASDGELTDQDRALFGGRPNFELVLGELLTTIRVMEALGLDATAVYARYQSIQAALGPAIRAVHLRRPNLPSDRLAAIRAELLRYAWVFTTSYDLLLYWAMGHTTWRPFIDHFMYGNRCEFDAARATVGSDDVPVYFLHGALHLVTGDGGVTWKRRNNTIRNLLEQFGEPIAGEPKARPLLVTEGSARDKLRAIEANNYLTFARKQLIACDVPMVVFGSSLGPQDDHLIDALNENPDRPVAVSMRAGPPKEVARKQSDIWGRLATKALVFFDAASHPLGRAALGVAEPS
jgi:hypothetical protein